MAGRYTIERELGRGGMATVYLAIDARHHRKVAVKVLHPELSAVIGSERFLKEIELTASLQHPHILPLFDSGTAEGQLYYVMPYVDGETLRARLDRERQLPIDDAVRIATEVASALEYAHRHHVVHRDIKPENVLLHDGSAVVADFGIALAVQDAGGERMTQTGLSLGTPQYMAPEQATGERNIGHRADIYALGAMTYEMLVGEPPFTGPTAQSIVAKVLTEEAAPPSRQRKLIPPGIEHAVLRSLEKLPADRWSSAQEFAEALATSRASRSAPVGGRSAVPWGWAVAAVAASLAAWGWLRHAPASAAWPPTQLSIVNPGAGVPGGGRHVDITPDGEKLVFYTNTGGRGVSMFESLDRAEPVVLPATEDGIDLHLSPDGRSVYFGNTGKAQLMRAAVEGGAAVPVRGAPSSAFIADGADGAMWISTPEFEIVHVARDGTVERRFTDVTPKLTIAIMQIFADGRTALAKDYNSSDGTLYTMDLVTGKLTTLLDFAVVEARVAAGLLIYVRSDGTLHAVPFDTRSMKPAGGSVQIGENVSLTGNGIAQFAVAATGTLVYVPAQPRELTLVDRTGKTTKLSDARRNFHMPRFSPDGRTIAMDFPSPDGRDIWTLDRQSGVLSRVTSEHDAHDPIWTRGGEILYSTRKRGMLSVHRTRPGSGVTTQVEADARLAFTGELLPDGKTMLTVATDFLKGSGTDIVLIDSAGRMTPVVAEPFNEGWSALSPGGRWIAYASTLSGQTEVYVRSLTGDADQTQISSTGGSEPMWSRDGRELFYRAEVDGHVALMAAEVEAGSPFRVLSRTKLFNVDEYDAAQPHANYDVSPDGKSFVMVHRAPTGRLTVIQNLPELVRRLTGAKAEAR